MPDPPDCLWRGSLLTGSIPGGRCAGPGVGSQPQFAYSTEKWASLQDDKLEFDEIADRIHEYNSTVEKNRIEYKDYQGKDSNEIAQEYYDAADEIESSIEYPDSDDANYGSALAAAQRSEASATQMREQGDNNVDDANVKAWGYTQTEKSLVQQAQNLMIQYWNAQENLKSVQNQVSKAEKDYETANLKLSSGSATQTDVLDAKETLLKAAGVHHDGGEQYCIDEGIPVPDAWMEIWRISRNRCITGPAGTDECIGQPRRGHCESTGK